MSFELKGQETVALDFANTIDWHISDHPEENLKSYDDLARWSFERKILNQKQLDYLLMQAGQNKGKADEVYRYALQLRENIFNIFLRNFKHQMIDAEEMHQLNIALQAGFDHLKLINQDNSFSWKFEQDDSDLGLMLWPVILSAVNLLNSPLLSQVKVCADETGCGWLFLDRSKNSSRRWCDMKDCGNRAKARRHYRRKIGIEKKSVH